jgi:hypothetical protein
LGLGELYQNSVSDDIISRQYLPAMRFLEEVNAYLEQLNAAKCHKDPFLVAFTLTTDEHISFGGKKRQIGIGGTSYLLFD